MANGECQLRPFAIRHSPFAHRHVPRDPLPHRHLARRPRRPGAAHRCGGARLRRGGAQRPLGAIRAAATTPATASSRSTTCTPSSPSSRSGAAGSSASAGAIPWTSSPARPRRTPTAARPAASAPATAPPPVFQLVEDATAPPSAPWVARRSRSRSPARCCIAVAGVRADAGHRLHASITAPASSRSRPATSRRRRRDHRRLRVRRAGALRHRPASRSTCKASATAPSRHPDRRDPSRGEGRWLVANRFAACRVLDSPSRLAMPPMKLLPPALQAHLDTGATTLCLVLARSRATTARGSASPTTTAISPSTARPSRPPPASPPARSRTARPRRRQPRGLRARSRPTASTRTTSPPASTTTPSSRSGASTGPTPTSAC